MKFFKSIFEHITDLTSRLSLEAKIDPTRHNATTTKIGHHWFPPCNWWNKTLPQFFLRLLDWGPQKRALGPLINL